jgi:hypothetical protein
VRFKLIAGLALATALPVWAESSTTLRVSGVIPPSCSLADEAVALQPSGAGTWTGTAGYACNSGHLVVLSLGQELAGAAIEIEGAGTSTADAGGQAVIYRRDPHFGPAVVSIRSRTTLQDVNARIVVQPL